VATFAENMVDRLQELLADNIGVKRVNVDGELVDYADLEEKLDYWERKVARAAGSRPRVMQVDLNK